jgi:hypothetical protein
LVTDDVINEIRVFGDVLNIGTPSDSTVTNAKTNFVSTSSAAGLSIKGDGTTDGTVQLNCSQNSHGVKIASPAHSAGQSYTIKLPTENIAADKIMKVASITGSGTSAVGQMSFVDAPADFVGFKAFASANQTISGSTSTQVTFGGELFDVGSNFASNAFTAPSDGKYLFFTQISVGALGNTSADVKFSHTVAGGSTFTGSATRMGPMDTSSRDGALGLTTILDMTQNSTVTVFIYLFSGKTLYGNSTGGNSGTIFGGFKIG